MVLMRGGVPMDPESDVVAEAWAVIMTPRRNRKRFPENCVEVHDSAEAALAAADATRNRHPARVYGPSRSSEGLKLYYLVQWLD